MFNFAIRQGWEHPNPCRAVKKFNEESRQRFLNADELKHFFKTTADEESETIRDQILLSLLAGSRSGNTLAMRWEDLDLHERTWTVIGAEAKRARPLVITLADQAVEILERRQGNGSPYVFPGRGKTGHLVDIRVGWRRILARAGLEDLRPHDLRRTMASWQAALGASLPIIGRSLGHQHPRTTQVYARLDLDPVRQSVSMAAKAMLECGPWQCD